MSYILDALRKSDHQRQLGATPTLRAAPPTASVPAQPGLGRKGWLLTAMVGALVGAGLLIGWLQPWQASPRAGNPSPATPTASPSAPPDAVPVPVPAPEPAPPITAPPGGIGLESPREAAATPAPAPSPTRTAPASPPPAGDGAEAVAAGSRRETPLPDAPPEALRAEIPDLVIAFHLYSPTPAERRVMINNELLREGATLAPGLTLERVTPDGVVLDYRGQRFKRTVR